MPSKSKAQFKEMFVLHKQGKITDGQLKDFTHNVDYQALPSRVKPTMPKMKKKKSKVNDNDFDD